MSYRTFTLGLLAAASLAGSLATLGVAKAADLDGFYGDAPPPEAETKVEFGSGWYIRGDIGVTRTQNVAPNGVSFNTQDPTVIPVPPTLSFTPSSKVGYTASLGAGYEFNHWFRAELMTDFHEPLKTSYQGGSLKCPGGFNAAGVQEQEGCSPHYTASLKNYDVLVNGYLDLGTWHGITPYVGAGVGMAFGHYSSSVAFTQSDGTSYNINPVDPTTGTVYHADLDTASSGTYYNFAFALMAGVSIDVYDHTKLDIGYRYLNEGHLPGSTSGSSLYEQEVRAGLRYMIDN